MLVNLTPFLLHWSITVAALWLASHVFNGIRFDSVGALVVSALLLGFANAVIRPLLILFTLPLTLLTLGFFVLVINALMVMLVAKVVKGFRVSSFWTAFFAAILIGILSLVINAMVRPDGAHMMLHRSVGGTWL